MVRFKPAAPVRHLRRTVPRTSRPQRPPQFVVVSFDGAGGIYGGLGLWDYWRAVARRTGAHFTFFVSGVYLLNQEHRRLYLPPRHSPGSSDIGFAQPDGALTAARVVRATLREIAAAYREGHEIGTHYNGHFCAPYSGNVGTWTEADWRRELREFDDLLFGASRNDGLRPAVVLPFGRTEIVGGRTPCLEGNLGTLYPVLAAHGFRYDASRVGLLGDWPRRRQGLWSFPLVEIPLAGHTFKVISMDYNFFANQTAAVGASPALAPLVERRTLASLRRVRWRSSAGSRSRDRGRAGWRSSG